MIPAFTIRNNGGDYNTQSNNAYQFSDAVLNFELTAGTPFTITIPTISSAVQASGASTVKLLAFFSFSQGADVFLKPDVLTTIALPTGTAVVGNTELNPQLFGGRQVVIGQQLQLLTSTANVFGTVRLYAMAQNI